jgi:nucleoside-diphosphate-sugar epimerase
MSRTPHLLILGATGGFGGAAAREALRRGWRVRALTRHQPPAAAERAQAPIWRGLEGVEWVRGDAMCAADVRAAAQGCDVIVHGVNPPGYVQWREKALPMLAHSVAAARLTGARLVLPGNVYNFGPDAGGVVTEASPQHPLTRKGRVRVEMEEMLAQAADDPDRPVRSLVLRAGDFFGGHAPSSWFGTAMLRAGRPVRRVVQLSRGDAGHAWAYLPDLAAALCEVLALAHVQPERLAVHEVLHFSGHWLPDGREMVAAIRRVSGVPGLRVFTLPWGLVRLLAPWVPLCREMLEMRYLWEVPIRLGSSRLQALIGSEPHTPLDDAVREAMTELGCLPSSVTGLRTAC